MRAGVTGLMVVDEAEFPSGRVEWEHVDVALRTIAKRRGALDALEAKWLREAIRLRIWREVGCPTLVDYLERRLGYSPRTAHDRVRVATALAELPAIERALASGFPHSAVRELTRVATPETEQKWLDACRGKSVHEIEREVAGRSRGALPGDPVYPDLVGRTVPFEGIRPATLALIRDARRRLQEERGNAEPISDDELLASFARAVLQGNAAESTRAPYQIAISLCEQCGAGWHTSGGRNYALSRADVERACCDAQRIGSLEADEPERAAQDVPPAKRRHVHRRDHGRCRIPGCRSTRCLEIHHIVARTLGGTHDSENLILLCDACHAALHRGLLSIRGTSSNLIVERLRPVTYDMDSERTVCANENSSTERESSNTRDACADKNSSTDIEASAHVGTNLPQADADDTATRDLSPRARKELRDDATQALISLGFRRADAVTAVGLALSRGGAPPSLEVVIREALRSCARR